MLKRRSRVLQLCLANLLVIFASVLLPSPVRGQEGHRMAFGDRVEGRITGAEYRQIFYFEARRGDVVSVSMTPTGGNLDPVVVLADNSGRVLASSDDQKNTLASAIETVQIPTDDFYFLIATRFGHAFGATEGVFELELQRVGVLSQAGVFLSYGDSVVGAVSAAAPAVRYVFEARRGDIITINMRRISGNLDAYVAVEDEKGQLAATNDDLDGSLDAAIDSLLILDPGFYTVVASRFGGEAGDSHGSFVLTLDTAPTSGQGRSPQSALLLRYGDEMIGMIDRDSPYRYYTFGAGRGDIVTISMDRTSNTLDPYLILSDAAGIQLAADDDSGPSNNALIQSFIIPQSGAYLIQAARLDRDAGVTAGNYVIRLQGVTGEAPVVAPGTLTVLYGSSVGGQITNDIPAITYAFLGNEGDVITIDMIATQETLDASLLLFTSASVQIAEDDDSGLGKNARIADFALPADDIYYIVASRYQFQGGETQGGFTLSLSRQSP
jgi:hypothetical protein